jgi:hypothetical protein
MLHDTCTQGNWVDSQLLVVGSQIANLILDPSFGHNLCCICPNGWCNPILDIYVLRAFQWYIELLKTLSFYAWNPPLKIWESIGSLSPKVGVALGVRGFIPSHSFALPGVCGVTLGLLSWPATLQAFCLGRKPKARVAIVCVLWRTRATSSDGWWRERLHWRKVCVIDDGR